MAKLPTVDPKIGMPAGEIVGSDFYGGYTIKEVEYYVSGKRKDQVKGVWVDTGGRELKFFFKKKSGYFINVKSCCYPYSKFDSSNHLVFPTTAPTDLDPGF